MMPTTPNGEHAAKKEYYLPYDLSPWTISSPRAMSM